MSEGIAETSNQMQVRAWLKELRKNLDPSAKAPLDHKDIVHRWSSFDVTSSYCFHLTATDRFLRSVDEDSRTESAIDPDQPRLQ